MGHNVVYQWVSHTIINNVVLQASSSYILFYIWYKKSLHHNYLFSQPHGNDLLTLMGVGEGHLTSIGNVMAFDCSVWLLVYKCEVLQTNHPS